MACSVVLARRPHPARPEPAGIDCATHRQPGGVCDRVLLCVRVVYFAYVSFRFASIVAALKGRSAQAVISPPGSGPPHPVGRSSRIRQGTSLQKETMRTATAGLRHGPDFVTIGAKRAAVRRGRRMNIPTCASHGPARCKRDRRSQMPDATAAPGRGKQPWPGLSRCAGMRGLIPAQSVIRAADRRNRGI